MVSSFALFLSSKSGDSFLLSLGRLDSIYFVQIAMLGCLKLPLSYNENAINPKIGFYFGTVRRRMRRKKYSTLTFEIANKNELSIQVTNCTGSVVCVCFLVYIIFFVRCSSRKFLLLFLL